MLGSYHWTRQTQGKLSFKEKMHILSKTLGPTTQCLLDRVSLSGTKVQPLVYNRQTLPDTPLVKAAIEQLEETHQAALINHSWRSYFWGIAFGQINQWQYDAETFLVAALLHDLGLSQQDNHSGCQCFTLDSAIYAEQLCHAHHCPEHQISLITDAICMHMNGFSEPTLPKEVLMLQKGTGCDVIGAELKLIHTAFQKSVLQDYPRHNFNQVFKTLIQQESRHCPDSRTAFLNTFGLSFLIQTSPFKE